MRYFTARPMRLAFVSGALIFGSTGCMDNPPPGETAIWVSYAPPRAPSESRPRAPGRTYVWIEGHYQWNSTAYVWVPGQWEQRPHPKAQWRKGGWHRGNRGYYWVDGRWEGR